MKTKLIRDYTGHLGTPPQNLTLRLTGDVISWAPQVIQYLPENCAFLEPIGVFTPQTSREQCEAQKAYGAYDRNHSRTDKLDERFGKAKEQPTPVSGIISKDTLLGTYLSDTLSWGSLEFKNFHFTSIESYYNIGALGLGYGWEDSAGGILRDMVDAGLIGIPGFAMYFDAHDTNSSQITFGAVDTEKYELPMVTEKRDDPVAVQGLNIIKMTLMYEGEVTSIFEDLVGVISPGISTLKLPGTFLDSVINKFRMKTDFSIVDYSTYVDCARAISSGVSVTFFFGKINITMTAKDLLGDTVDRGQGVPYCELLLDKSEDGDTTSFARQGLGSGATVYLGIPFLRVAYVWLDYQNKHTSLAKAKQNAKTSNIVVIPKKGIISALGAQNGPSANDTALPPPAIPTETLTSPENGEGKRGPHPPVVIGAVASGVAVLCALGYLIFWLGKRNIAPKPPLPPMEELDGRSKYDMDADHGKSEVFGSIEYPGELPTDHEQPVELPAPDPPQRLIIDPVADVNSRSED
ncbi:hypothetical protein TWF281_006574 [Arthrobotrys megalospora]